MKDILYAFGIVMLSLLMLSMVFKVVKAEEPKTKLECSSFINEKICNMTEAEAEQWFWGVLQAIIDEGRAPENEPVDESSIHVNLNNIEKKELITI